VRILQVTTMTNLNKTADRKRATRKRPVAGVGRIIGWPGGSLWIGRHVGRIQDHAHHAIQISLAMAGSFEVQASSWPQPRETRGMVVMPDRRHRFDGRGAMVATLFVEPNSVRGAALKQRFTGFDLALLRDAEVNPAVVNLKNRYAAAAPDESMRHSAEAAICRIAGKPSTVAETDRRVTSAIAWMGRRLGTPIRLDEVAAAVHLSPSRFRHLFVSHTGVSLRAWLLWARVDHAVTTAFGGRSWTDAAHESGFADAAHLTRTCRRVFGLAPTMLVPESPAR
jgi:AraC-like DNA-binding protein